MKLYNGNQYDPSLCECHGDEDDSTVSNEIPSPPSHKPASQTVNGEVYKSYECAQASLDFLARADPSHYLDALGDGVRCYVHLPLFFVWIPY